MSLVGPRPIVSKELEELYAPLGAVAAYVAVRPGLTRPRQVSGCSRVAYTERVRLDAEYATRLSLRTDLKILARTVKVVLLRDGAC